MFLTPMFFVIFFTIFMIPTTHQSNDVIAPIQTHTIIVDEQIGIEFVIQNHSTKHKLKNGSVQIRASECLASPEVVPISNWTIRFDVKGLKPVANGFVEVLNCSVEGFEKCPLNITEAFVRITVIRSRIVEILVDIVGWMYFFAWSISFYPQIWMNFKRKSVIGLNFDFLGLNLIGFGAYSIYNLLMYFNEHVQQIYHYQNPRSPPPVLLNDVVFAVHAFFACSVTIVQCLIYEKENQKLSAKCIFLIIALLSFGFVTSACTIFDKITILQFVTSLSYIKMVVTLCKYFPQAFFNYQRQSTIGWSIGNVLLDFTGGVLDILQMILQALNVNDGSAFYANPVKFGLGLISIVFDVIFIFQHYVLYKSVEVAHNNYEGVENPDLISADDSENVFEESLEQPIIQVRP